MIWVNEQKDAKYKNGTEHFDLPFCKHLKSETSSVQEFEHLDGCEKSKIVFLRKYLLPKKSKLSLVRSCVLI